MMLNPPIALFDEEDRQRFVNNNDQMVGQINGVGDGLISNNNGVYYPDYLRENQEMTDQVNQVISDDQSLTKRYNNQNMIIKRSRAILKASSKAVSGVGIYSNNEKENQH